MLKSRRSLILSITLALAILAIGLWIAVELLFKNRFPTTSRTPAEINASDESLRNLRAVLSEADPNDPVPFRVLFYGQSIIESGWPGLAMTQLQEIYPGVEFAWENRAIGGFSAEHLVRTVSADIADTSPDLIVFHVYGNHNNYTEIVETLLRNTEADVILQTDHATDWPVPKCPIGPRLLPGEPEGCTGWPLLKQSAWEDYMSYHLVPSLADRYGLAVQPVRQVWAETLAEEGLAPDDVLSDGLHLNARGKRMMADIFVDFVTAQIGGDAVAARRDTAPLPSPTPEGNYEITTSASRLEAVSRASLGPVEVTVDGTPVSDLAECVAHGRPSRVFSDLVWPGLRQIGADANLVPETWTATLTNFSSDFSDFSFRISGSVTGPDGEGRAGENFESSSGRVVIDSSDWTIAWAHDYTDRPVPDPLEIKWESQDLCIDVETVSIPGEGPYVFTTLAAGLNGSSHTIDIRTEDAEKIEYLLFTEPRL